VDRSNNERVPVYEGRNYICVPVGNDDSTLVDEMLLESPMQGWVRLVFSLGAQGLPEAKSEKNIILVKEKEPPHAAVALYALERMRLHIDSVPSDMVYLGLLRVRPAFRGKIAVLRDGFASIPYFTKVFGLPERYFTSIAADNSPARRILEASLKQLPRYAFQGEMRSMAFSTTLAKDYGLLETAQREDWPELEEFFNRLAKGFQYAPVLGKDTLTRHAGELNTQDFLLLRQNGRLCACLALWDRCKSRRMIATGYRQPLETLRPAYNLWAHLRRLPALPRPGAELRSVHLAFAAFAPEAMPLARQCLLDALHRARHVKETATVFMGLSAQSPLLEIFGKLPHFSYITRIESVDWDKDAPMQPSTSTPQVQPEIALL
jgi:hypothetical protein